MVELRAKPPCKLHSLSTHPPVGICAFCLRKNSSTFHSLSSPISDSGQDTSKSDIFWVRKISSLIKERDPQPIRPDSTEVLKRIVSLSNILRREKHPQPTRKKSFLFSLYHIEREELPTIPP
ncbi:hypothetical protein AMTRI_Chr10g6680 [Amborella trichopoda]